MSSYSRGEIVLVRYPFSDLSGSKIRPAIIVNAHHSSQDVFILPLTSKTKSLLVGEFILSEMGSPNPEVELRILVYLAKERRVRFERNSNELPTRRQLKYAEEKIEEAQEQFKEAKKQKKEEGIDTPPKKSRRWFKGIGQIGQGAALSIANIGLAVGALKFPVSPETQTWGAVASVATGIATILNGVGDLRNE